MHEIHALLGGYGGGGGAGPVSLASEHLRLMKAEGVPLVWGRAGIILAIVNLKESGDLRGAAAWAAVSDGACNKKDAKFMAYLLGKGGDGKGGDGKGGDG